MVMRDLDSLENYNFLWDDVWMTPNDTKEPPRPEISSEED